MSAPADYTTVSFWIPWSLRKRLKALYPKHGDLSRIFRLLAQKLVEGKLKNMVE